MTPEVWYVAGAGLLVGADRRWLLLDDDPEEAFVASLWETIAGSGVERVLMLLESHYGDQLPSLAMTGSGREITRGAGEVTNDRVGIMLSLGPSSATASGQRRRPFRGGVVVRGPGRDPCRRARRPHGAGRSQPHRRHPRRHLVVAWPRRARPAAPPERV